MTCISFDPIGLVCGRVEVGAGLARVVLVGFA